MFTKLFCEIFFILMDEPEQAADIFERSARDARICANQWAWLFFGCAVICHSLSGRKRFGYVLEMYVDAPTSSGVLLRLNRIVSFLANVLRRPRSAVRIFLWFFDIFSGIFVGSRRVIKGIQVLIVVLRIRVCGRTI